jgi:hypothetical protein
MGKKPSEPVKRPLSGTRASLSVRLEAVRHLNTSSARRRVPVQHIADALVGAGYTSLEAQAKALGIHRATAWTIIKAKHKLGYLNAKTTKRMLANPELPPCIRDVLQRYVTERPLLGRRSKRRVTQAADNAAEDK